MPKTLTLHSTGQLYPKGIRLTYLRINNAYAVMWHDSVLRIFNREDDAREYVEMLLGSE